MSIRQVGRLVESGELAVADIVGRSLLIDARSVHQLNQRGSRRGRPWSADTSRAAVELLKDGVTTLLNASQRSKLRQKLRKIDAEELVGMTRATISRYRASVSM